MRRDDDDTAEQLAELLRQGIAPKDALFDALLPDRLREVSGQYWTPLSAAVRVAKWLDAHDARSVVDIGSGAGKFCVAAALAGSARFYGVEQRPRLVTAARALAERFEVQDRVTFEHGQLGHTPLPSAEAYYLYNPFEENIFRRDEHLDDEVELGRSRYLHDVFFVEQLLVDAPPGTFLVTYNGFGGYVPEHYREVHEDLRLPCALSMWEKVARRPWRTNEAAMVAAKARADERDAATHAAHADDDADRRSQTKRRDTSS